MIRFTLKQLSYFVAAAEHGSTLEASEVLHVSQPAISMAIKHLEETFGQRLFVRRHAQGIDLTPFGRRKLAEARHLIDSAYAMGDPEGERLTGHLEIGLFTTLAPLYAPALLQVFQEAHPNISVRVREATLEQLHRDLNAGTIELAILYDLDIASDIRRFPLGEVLPYALVSADHPLGSKAAISIDELAQHPFILIDLPGSREIFLSIFRTHGVTPERIVCCTSLEMVRGLVANGLGVSILTTRPVGDMSYDGLSLVCRPIAEKVSPQPVILAGAARMPLTHLARAFIETTRQHFDSLSGCGSRRGDATR